MSRGCALVCATRSPAFRPPAPEIEAIFEHSETMARLTKPSLEGSSRKGAVPSTTSSARHNLE